MLEFTKSTRVSGGLEGHPITLIAGDSDTAPWPEEVLPAQSHLSSPQAASPPITVLIVNTILRFDLFIGFLYIQQPDLPRQDGGGTSKQILDEYYLNFKCYSW